MSNRKFIESLIDSKFSRNQMIKKIKNKLNKNKMNLTGLPKSITLDEDITFAELEYLENWESLTISEKNHFLDYLEDSSNSVSSKLESVRSDIKEKIKSSFNLSLLKRFKGL